MAKQRKVGNLLALAVLSVVVQRPMHPYEMASQLRIWGKDQDMPIKWGSLYTVVRNLARHGLLAAVESTREGGRPERTVYRITDAGREELVDWVRELVSIPEPERLRFKAGLSVLVILPPEEARALLERRLALLEEDLAGRREALARQRLEVQALFLVEAEYDLALREAEAAWVRSLVERLASGTLSGLGEWRSWHEGSGTSLAPGEGSGTTTEQI